ncbi:unnamed protein product [Polarella glacialis]|uniref:Uncharacterized protein n=1 Tax=Polarella glacialis TaxID=89957 RepID=A0A813JP59_POLGL|nr:unnamed protein product [Polarella glacialis]
MASGTLAVASGTDMSPVVQPSGLASPCFQLESVGPVRRFYAATRLDAVPPLAGSPGALQFSICEIVKLRLESASDGAELPCERLTASVPIRRLASAPIKRHIAAVEVAVELECMACQPSHMLDMLSDFSTEGSEPDEWIELEGFQGPLYPHSMPHFGGELCGPQAMLSPAHLHIGGGPSWPAPC